MKDCDHYKGLIVGLLDGELTPDEAREVNEHLIRCASCRADYERLRETSGKLTAGSFQEPGDALLKQIWRSPYSRFARIGSLAMILGGYALLAGYALFEMLTGGPEAFTVKVAVAAIVIGFVVLLAQLIHQRLRGYQVDPYKEIER